MEGAVHGELSFQHRALGERRVCGSLKTRVQKYVMQDNDFCFRLSTLGTPIPLETEVSSSKER